MFVYFVMIIMKAHQYISWLIFAYQRYTDIIGNFVEYLALFIIFKWNIKLKRCLVKVFVFKFPGKCFQCICSTVKYPATIMYVSVVLDNHIVEVLRKIYVYVYMLRVCRIS